MDLRNDLVWYYLVLALLAAALYGMHRLVHSRFGRVIDAIRENEARAEAIGFPVYRYKLAVLRHRRRRRRPRRRADRQPGELRQPEPAALDPVGHADDHGDPRRRRHAAGAA